MDANNLYRENIKKKKLTKPKPKPKPNSKSKIVPINVNMANTAKNTRSSLKKKN